MRGSPTGRASPSSVEATTPRRTLPSVRMLPPSSSQVLMAAFCCRSWLRSSAVSHGLWHRAQWIFDDHLDASKRLLLGGRVFGVPRRFATAARGQSIRGDILSDEISLHCVGTSLGQRLVISIIARARIAIDCHGAFRRERRGSFSGVVNALETDISGDDDTADGAHTIGFVVTCHTGERILVAFRTQLGM